MKKLLLVAVLCAVPFICTGSEVVDSKIGDNVNRGVHLAIYVGDVNNGTIDNETGKISGEKQPRMAISSPAKTGSPDSKMGDHVNRGVHLDIYVGDVNNGKVLNETGSLADEKPKSIGFSDSPKEATK